MYQSHSEYLVENFTYIKEESRNETAADEGKVENVVVTL